MKLFVRCASIAAGLSLALSSTAAFAGTPVYGHGETKSAAMAQADSRAQNEASRRQTCISEYARPETCVANNGMWTCHAIVANHMGSCRR